MAAVAPIALGAGLLGTAASTTSNLAAADARAKAATSEATSITQQAQFEETQARRQNRLIMGEANAQTAGAGLALTSGTPLFNELDRAKQAEIQALNIRRTGQVAAQGKQYEARMARRMVPGIIGQGIGNATSILTSFLGRQ